MQRRAFCEPAATGWPFLRPEMLMSSQALPQARRGIIYFVCGGDGLPFLADSSMRPRWGRGLVARREPLDHSRNAGPDAWVGGAATRSMYDWP